MKNTKKIFKIVFTGILIALMFTLSWTIFGMVPLSASVSATTVFIPVAIGIIIMDDYRVSAVLGVSFGLVALIRATAPVGPLDPFFLNPLVSVLPRFCAAMATHFCFRSLSKVIKKPMICCTIAGGLMALFNTIFTIPTLILVYYDDLSLVLLDFDWTIGIFLGSIALSNMLPEIIIGAILTFIIYKAYGYRIYQEQDEIEYTADTDE